MKPHSRLRKLLFAAPAMLLLAGCQRPQSSLFPEGPAAGKIAPLSWLMIILFLVITFIMWVLIVWGIFRRRGTFEEHAPVDVGGGQGWIGIGGFGIPFIVLCILFVLGLRAMAGFPIKNGNPLSPAPEILVIGHQWWWEVHYVKGGPDQYFKTANEIHVPVGKPVDIELASSDVIHSFWIPALHGKVDLVPGQSNYIRIQADHEGTFSGQCAEYCGAQHAHMKLIVVAQQPKDYEAWLAHQREPAKEPTEPEAVQGEQVFLSAPCMLCHQVRGTLAGGSVAPDLTHIGSRKGIAANTLVNNEANLAGWVTHAQSLKPAAAMPNITQFDGKQLRELVAYLQQLQ